MALGNKEIMSRNIQHYMNIKNKTRHEICKDLGVKYTTFTDWLNGNTYPRIDKIELMANYFGITKADLVEDNRGRNANRIPVLGRVAAGIPIDAIEDIIDYEEVDDKLSQLGELFGLKIKGDSMTPRICDGDIVIVHQQSTADSGDIVIATINGDDAVCKKLQIFDKTVLLYSLNPLYDPIDVTGRSDFKIVGKVIELRGKL